MLRAKLAAFASTLILAGSAFANTSLCPELNAIKAEGVSMTFEMMGLYATYTMSDYNTGKGWTFIMAPLEADSEEDALNFATDILNNMNAPGVYSNEGDLIRCSYDTGSSDIIAWAIQDVFLSPAKIKSLMHKA